jgi:hypothetical protein
VGFCISSDFQLNVSEDFADLLQQDMTVFFQKKMEKNKKVFVEVIPLTTKQKMSIRRSRRRKRTRKRKVSTRRGLRTRTPGTASISPSGSWLLAE